MEKEIVLQPIGYVITDIEDTVDENWGNVVSRIELFDEFQEGLSGLKDFSHAIILTFLHRANYERAKHLKRRPRGLDSMPLVGIFSQRAKDRPNPIGITSVEIVIVGNSFLEVRGLDAVNKTPVLDIKPYFPQYDRVESPTAPDWVERLMKNYF
ncbi:MAG: tRNA (N6-threonylcarbamoyladenosine(37)-N6)-methyltransferase TrmO [Leptospiraceae bacterium]|nr:tRNA (N6-threonylcarbamoyladenosine(37)-N6)-methyltransferase TrmO [Leptospiraceae bacterium]